MAPAASAVIAEIVEQTLRDAWLRVSRNKPYAGGFITEHYGNPATGLHAIQLEINRALYMDERRYERSSTFDQLTVDLETLAVAWAKSRWKNCGPIARQRVTIYKKKGPLAFQSGPSLGRKRPRRATAR